MTATQDAPTTEKPTEIGRDRRRKEDQRLITGRTRWTDNLVLPGMLHAAILRSPFAHATITSLDVTEARQRPGVIAVYTGKDFAEEQGSLPCAWAVTPEMKAPPHPSIAVDTVHFTGEAVAVVIARTTYEVDRTRRAQAAVEPATPAREPVDRSAPEQMSEQRPSPSTAPALGL